MPIGGIPTDSVTEDILPTLVLLRTGYVTRYLNEPLAFGLSPESIAGIFVQRQRWCRGGLQFLFLRDGVLGPGLDLIQRLLFFPIDWLVQLPRSFSSRDADLYLWTGVPPLHVALRWTSWAISSPPWFLRPDLCMAGSARVRAGADDGDTHVYGLPPGADGLATLIKPFGEPFRVTPKGAAGRRGASDRITASVALCLLLACLGGLSDCRWAISSAISTGLLRSRWHALCSRASSC